MVGLHSVSGMNYALTSAKVSGRPSVAIMSLGGSPSTVIDNAVASVKLVWTV